MVQDYQYYDSAYPTLHSNHFLVLKFYQLSSMYTPDQSFEAVNFISRMYDKSVQPMWHLTIIKMPERWILIVWKSKTCS
jgi:hypothetical protein